MNMRHAFIAATLIGFLSGCATVKDTYSSDGKKAYTLNCSGAARGWDKCYSAAGELCKEAGYEILNRSSEDASFASVGGGSGGFIGSATKTNERSMVVACKS